jgi:hypothetical protein
MEQNIYIAKNEFAKLSSDEPELAADTLPNTICPKRAIKRKRPDQRSVRPDCKTEVAFRGSSTGSS